MARRLSKSHELNDSRVRTGDNQGRKVSVGDRRRALLVNVPFLVFLRCLQVLARRSLHGRSGMRATATRIEYQDHRLKFMVLQLPVPNIT